MPSGDYAVLIDDKYISFQIASTAERRSMNAAITDLASNIIDNTTRHIAHGRAMCVVVGTPARKALFLAKEFECWMLVGVRFGVRFGDRRRVPTGSGSTRPLSPLQKMGLLLAIPRACTLSFYERNRFARRGGFCSAPVVFLQSTFYSDRRGPGFSFPHVSCFATR